MVATLFIKDCLCDWPLLRNGDGGFTASRRDGAKY